jgi:hypothetical protein
LTFFWRCTKYVLVNYYRFFRIILPSIVKSKEFCFFKFYFSLGIGLKVKKKQFRYWTTACGLDDRGV